MASGPVAPERPRILATDDRPEVLRLVERTLGDRYACDFASDVETAREKLRETAYELALCDIQMPGESGLVLVEDIVRDWPETAVVLVTGVDDPAVADQAFQLGAHGYLVKPFWPGQLLITTMTALRRRELELAQKSHSRTLEERFQTMMDRAPVPIYIKDRERRYVVANRVAHEVAGLEPRRAGRPHRRGDHAAGLRAGGARDRPPHPRRRRAVRDRGDAPGRDRASGPSSRSSSPTSTTAARSSASPASRPTSPPNAAPRGYGKS